MKITIDLDGHLHKVLIHDWKEILSAFEETEEEYSFESYIIDVLRGAKLDRVRDD